MSKINSAGKHSWAHKLKPTCTLASTVSGQVWPALRLFSCPVLRQDPEGSVGPFPTGSNPAQSLQGVQEHNSTAVGCTLLFPLRAHSGALLIFWHRCSWAIQRVSDGDCCCLSTSQGVNLRQGHFPIYTKPDSTVLIKALLQSGFILDKLSVTLVLLVNCQCGGQTGFEICVRLFHSFPRKKWTEQEAIENNYKTNLW